MNMGKRARWMAAAIAGAAAVALGILLWRHFRPQGDNAVQAIEIGVLAPFNTPPGNGIVNGVQMAVDEINAAGGVLGRPLHVNALDTGYSTEKAVEGYQRLAGVDRVTAVVGFASGGVFGVAPLLEQYRVPVIVTGVGADGLTALVAEDYEKHRYLFRVMHRSSEIGEATADYALNCLHRELGFSRFAIMVEDDIWAKGIRDGWEQMIRDNPELTLVYSGTFSGETHDFVPLLTEIIQQHPDYILDASSMVDATLYIKQWAELEGPPLGAIPTGAGTRRYYEELGDRGRGVASIATIPSRINALTPRAPQWWETYVERFGDPEYTSAYSYDAVYILKAALERAGSTDADALITALEATRHDGIVGTYEFGRDHHPKYGPSYRRIPIIQYERPGTDGFHVIWPRDLAQGPFTYPAWDRR